MNIGIDVDGVLTDQAAYQLKYAPGFFRQKYGMNVKNPEGYDIEDIFQCAHSQREAFWRKYIWRYCLCAPMAQGAAETAAALRSAGHRIYIITGRAHTTEKGVTGALFRYMLRHWLRKNHFPYDELIFCSEKKSSEEKTDICVRENIHVMIDDKPENLSALKGVTQIICYSAIWNERFDEFDFCRIHSFQELSAKMEQISSLR